MELLTQTSHLWVYTLLVIGIIVIPGMDMGYVIASSLMGGLKSGAAAVLGIVVGGITHVLMSVIGISLLVKTSPNILNIMLVLGSAYIIYIGVSLIKGASPMSDINAHQPKPLWKTFSQAVMTCLLNPKAYLFMIAVFPQYIKPEYGSMTVQFIILGMIISVIQIIIYGGYAIGANGLRVWLKENTKIQVYTVQMIGVILILTALYSLAQLRF